MSGVVGKPERAIQMLYSLLDASRELGGISVWTLRKHIAQGSVQPTRLGRRVFLSSEEISRIQREGLPSLRVEAKANPDFGTNPNSRKEKEETCLTK